MPQSHLDSILRVSEVASLVKIVLRKFNLSKCYLFWIKMIFASFRLESVFDVNFATV